MYMDYSRLWKKLIDKNMTKTELMTVTGLSSRILAKLTKNETVTTETLAKICCALNCKVEDIMECKEEKKMSIYNYYKKFGKVVAKEENYKVINFVYNETKFVVYLSKKSGNKSNIFHCKDNGTIFIEQFYLFGGLSGPSTVEKALVKPKREKDEITIVVIPGKPYFTGIDEGIFVSSRCELKNENSIYVMSEASFKLFELDKK